MGVTTGIIGAVAAVAGTASSVVQGNKARADARAASDKQQQATNEVAAQNAQQAAEAQRQQLRDQRVRQARIMQASTNSGADSSSGELGALGSLATNLSNNQGIMLGTAQRSQTISDLNQSAANDLFNSRQDSQLGSEFASFGQVGGSIFGASAKTPSGAKAFTSIFK